MAMRIEDLGFWCRQAVEYRRAIARSAEEPGR
jgi:hypothetical protein